MAAVHMRPGCGSLPDTGIICSWGTDRGDATRRSQHDISHLSVHFHAICSCLNKIIHYLYRHHYWKDKDAGKILLRQTDGICRNYSPANSVCGFMKNLRINAAISNGGSEHRRYFHRMPGRRRLQSHGQLPAFHKQLCPVQWYRPPFSAWPTDQRLRPAPFRS